MYTIKIQVPEKTCEGCAYLKTQAIDHNYYGECSKKDICTVFGVQIMGLNKCSECLQKGQNECCSQS